MAYRAKHGVGKSFFHCITAALPILFLAGCAGLEARPPVAAPPSGAREKLAQADGALAAARRQVAAFYADLGAVREKVDAFRSRPWWGGFERVLLQCPALTDPDREAEMTPEIKSRLSAWSRGSKIAWETAVRDYFQLADRCAILDMKRVAARRKLISVQAAYMAVVMMDASAGDQKDAQKIFSLVNSLDKPGADLDAIRLNRLGLYGAGP